MRNNPPIIGITGGIGSGKSLVANFLQDNGCVVADADANTKIVLAPSVALIKDSIKERVYLILHPLNILCE